MFAQGHAVALRQDPRQQVNVIRDHPERAQAMRQELARIKAHPTAPHARRESETEKTIGNEAAAGP